MPSTSTIENFRCKVETAAKHDPTASYISLLGKVCIGELEQLNFRKRKRSSSLENSRQVIAALVETLSIRLEILEEKALTWSVEGAIEGQNEFYDLIKPILKVDEIDSQRFEEILGSYQAVLAFISTIEATGDIRYYFQASINGKCPVRGCGIKISAKKLLIKHCRSTESVEHRAAFKILTQTWCYQCGSTVKKFEGIDNHLLRKHSESRSRIDLLKEYFEPSQYSPSTSSWSKLTLDSNELSAPSLSANGNIATPSLEAAVKSLDSEEGSNQDLQSGAVLDSLDPHQVHITPKPGPTDSSETLKSTDKTDTAVRMQGRGDSGSKDPACYHDPCVVQETPLTMV